MDFGMNEGTWKALKVFGVVVLVAAVGLGVLIGWLVF
jgi:hypothetical protein